MWNKKLAKIKDELKKYDKEVNLGATSEEVECLRKTLKSEFDIDIPKEYEELLKQVNGIEFNGCIFYGIDENLLCEKPKQDINGIIEENQIWYENEEQTEYLFIGDSSISWYVYLLKIQEYFELDKPSGDIMEKFDTIDELFNQLLADSLG